MSEVFSSQWGDPWSSLCRCRPPWSLLAISVIRNEPQALTPPLSPGSPTLLAQVGSTSRIGRARRQTLDGHSQPQHRLTLLTNSTWWMWKDRFSRRSKNAFEKPLHGWQLLPLNIWILLLPVPCLNCLWEIGWIPTFRSLHTDFSSTLNFDWIGEFYAWQVV